MKNWAWDGDDTSAEVALNVEIIEGVDRAETIIRVVERENNENNSHRPTQTAQKPTD